MDTTLSQITPAEFVIAKFGGLTATAKAIGKPITTVQGWKERGQVPQAHWLELIAAAKDTGETIDLADFLTSHPSPQMERAS
jgi:hypothetical protein